VFPVEIGLRDPRSQKRDLGHPSISPFDIAEGTNFVISLPTRCSESAARDDNGKGNIPLKVAAGRRHFLSSSVGRRPMGLLVDVAKAIVGLRPSFSAHVRSSERGAPVRFPLISLIPSDVSRRQTVGATGCWLRPRRESFRRFCSGCRVHLPGPCKSEYRSGPPK
jgi:hypothetical protein